MSKQIYAAKTLSPSAVLISQDIFFWRTAVSFLEYLYEIGGIGEAAFIGCCSCAFTGNKQTGCV